jgi:hypothetical protein
MAMQLAAGSLHGHRLCFLHPTGAQKTQSVSIGLKMRIAALHPVLTPMTTAIGRISLNVKINKVRDRL